MFTNAGVGVSEKGAMKAILVSVMTEASDKAVTNKADQLPVSEHDSNVIPASIVNIPVEESTTERAPPFAENEHDVNIVSATVWFYPVPSSNSLVPPSPDDNVESNEQLVFDTICQRDSFEIAVRRGPCRHPFQSDSARRGRSE
ncbi:hypothetical protein BLNAU_8287 [Blattamonas nauphoetae]|uniref:Uncharacterized protein n=1 Tax=Blattamonas nauphoetae TaxID=2049346 RepID=A0ABQ9XZD5_9EUKA|nr:hypothetical protein BLNAU_8287 [Blattamonas nauphoetae]